MRKTVGLLLVAALLAVPALANSKLFNAAVTVTTSNATISFVDNHSGGDGSPFLANQIIIRSDSASAETCYFDPLDDTATTADIPLEPGASINFPLGRFYADSSGFAEMGVICPTSTADWTITAVR